MELIQKTELRDALAAEPTFLAWIRTGLGLMGFGFIVARFGVFLKQLTDSVRALSVVLWPVALVWNGVDSSGGCRLGSLSMASYSSRPRVDSRRRSAFPSTHGGCGNSAVPGFGRIDDGNLPGFRAGFEQCPRTRKAGGFNDANDRTHRNRR